MLRFCVLLSVLATPVVGGDYVSDAFGIVPTSELSSIRAEWSGAKVSTSLEIVEAGLPATISIFVGPKALVAGRDQGHAVALSFDEHGNLVQNKSIGFSFEGDPMTGGEVTDGIADVLFDPGTVSGTYKAGAHIGGVQSSRALYRVTADLSAVPLPLKGVPVVRTEMFLQLSSGPLADQYGNLLEDGIGTTFLLAHDNGDATQLSVPVRDGKAEATILGRDIDTGGAVDLNLGASFATGEFEYLPAKPQGVPALKAWLIEDINAIGLRFGPVATTAGHLLADGSPVEITLTAMNGVSLTTSGWLQDGVFEAVVQRLSSDGTFTASFSTAIGTGTQQVTLAEAAPSRLREEE